MSNFEPLQEGQEVFLKRPVQIFAKVIGPRASDWGLPEEQVYYAVQLMPLEQYYLPEDLELANQLQPKSYGSSESGRERAPIGEAVLNLSAGNSFAELAQEIDSLIACRAYELYERRGFIDGHDAEDWFHAVSEILLNVPADITETETELTIRADVPGVSAKDLEVRVAPRSVCIIGKRQALPERTEVKSVYSERRSNQIFRVWDLPYEIDPYRVAASVGDGILELKLSKVASSYVAAGYAQAASA